MSFISVVVDFARNPLTRLQLGKDSRNDSLQ